MFHFFVLNEKTTSGVSIEIPVDLNLIRVVFVTVGPNVNMSFYNFIGNYNQWLPPLVRRHPSSGNTSYLKGIEMKIEPDNWYLLPKFIYTTTMLKDDFSLEYCDIFCITHTEW